MTSYEDFKEELLRDPEVKREYDHLQETKTKPEIKPKVKPDLDPQRILTPERLCPSQRRKLPEDL